MWDFITSSFPGSIKPPSGISWLSKRTFETRMHWWKQLMQLGWWASNCLAQTRAGYVNFGNLCTALTDRSRNRMDHNNWCGSALCTLHLLNVLITISQYMLHCVSFQTQTLSFHLPSKPCFSGNRNKLLISNFAQHAKRILSWSVERSQQPTLWKRLCSCC